MFYRYILWLKKWHMYRLSKGVSTANYTPIQDYNNPDHHVPPPNEIIHWYISIVLGLTHYQKRVSPGGGVSQCTMGYFWERRRHFRWLLRGKLGQKFVPQQSHSAIWHNTRPVSCTIQKWPIAIVCITCHFNDVLFHTKGIELTLIQFPS